MARIGRALKMSAIALAAAAGLVYAIDTATLFARGKDNPQLYSDVAVDQVFTSTNKWKEVEWSRGTAVTERCVYALFPHFGNRPCWYVQRHTMRVNSTD